MHIGIDIDGVLADFTGACRLAAREAGIEIPDDGGPHDYKMQNWFTMSEDRNRVISAALDGCKDMDVIDPLAHEAMCQLSAVHEVTIITARSAFAPDAAMRDSTLAWLDRHGYVSDRVLFEKDKIQHGLDVLLDDAPSNIIAAREAGMDSVIFDQPYNQCLLGTRVGSLGEFAALMT